MDAAIAQYGQIVSQGQYFLDAVRNIENGQATVLQLAEQVEQMMAFCLGQHRRRLVQHQQARGPGHSAQDLGLALLSCGQAGHRRVDMEAKTVLLAELGRLGPTPPPVVQKAAAPRFVAQRQVLGHGQAFGQHAVLRHEANAGPLGVAVAAEGQRPAVHHQLA